jgi:hypothetical protein
MRGIHGIQPVAIVDEAHLLDREMLEKVRFLLNFKMDAEGPMALILPLSRGYLIFRVPCWSAPFIGQFLLHRAKSILGLFKVSVTLSKVWKKKKW